MQSRARASSLNGVIALVAFVGVAILGVVIGVKFQRERDSARFARTHGSLGQLELALHAYHLDYGRFPPAYLAGKDGTPMHSWRVLLLPYLEEIEREAYKRCDFSEAWDGPHNRALAQSMNGAPLYFRGHDDKMADKSWTTYAAVADPGWTWPRNKPLLAYLVTRGSDHFLLVEVPNSGIHWMEPRDWAQEW